MILDDHRHGRGRPLARSSLLALSPSPIAIAIAVPVAVFLATHRGRLAIEPDPIEADVGVRVLERLADLFIERLSSHPHRRRRAKEVEDAGALGALGWAIGVHDERGFEPPLVS